VGRAGKRRGCHAIGRRARCVVGAWRRGACPASRERGPKRCSWRRRWRGWFECRVIGKRDRSPAVRRRSRFPVPSSHERHSRTQPRPRAGYECSDRSGRRRDRRSPRWARTEIGDVALRRSWRQSPTRVSRRHCSVPRPGTSWRQRAAPIRGMVGQSSSRTVGGAEARCGVGPLSAPVMCGPGLRCCCATVRADPSVRMHPQTRLALAVVDQDGAPRALHRLDREGRESGGAGAPTATARAVGMPNNVQILPAPAGRAGARDAGVRPLVRACRYEGRAHRSHRFRVVGGWACGYDRAWADLQV
jgi:hypothetical protein